MHSVVRSSLVSVSRASTRFSCRRIAKRRLPHPSRAFHHKPSAGTPGGGANASDGTNTNQNGQDYSEGFLREETASHKDNCTALSVPSVKDLAHYGSAARRSKRSKSHTEVTPSVRIPEWFLENNVHPVEESGKLRIALLNWDAEKAEYVDPRKSLPPATGDASGAEPSENSAQPEIDQDIESPSRAPYYVDSMQWDELTSTVRGLLKLTTQFVPDDVASRKNNLILHYAGEGGDYLLDELVQKLAVELKADTVVLDALDIADLTCEPHNSSLSDDAADDRRLLSYDVYQKEDTQTNDHSRKEDHSDELEEPDEEDHPASMRPSLSTIFLDVRGSILDPSAGAVLRGRRGSRQAESSPPTLSYLGSFPQGRIASEANSAKLPQPPLVPLVEALLAGPFLKRTLRQQAPANDTEPTEPSPTTLQEQVESPLILEIRNIKLVQETAFGRKFLHTLYQHVKSARRRGRKVMIIGTDTFPRAEQYSPDNIRNLQSEPPGNMTRTIVVTPVVPSMDARLVLMGDKKRRVRTINMRHLWQMLCIKVPGLYDNNSSREEWMSLSGEFASEAAYALDYVGAERQLWTFDQVHRLATMMVGQLDTGASISIKDCLNQACMSLKGSDNVKFAWTEQQKAARTKSKPDIERTESQRLDKIRKTLTKYEKKLIGGVIEPDKIVTTFDHVHAPLDTIDALKTLTTLSLVRPDAFRYGVLSSDRIPGLLLYGPPGTGKTLLAKAVAKESGATVLEVSGAELNDMYVGEGEKNVKALFNLAKKLKPCVVFIDEADAVFSARGGSQRRVSHRELLNQFLREWDGMSNDAGSAFIMVATNRPFDLDDAVLRRLPRRLLVDLPSENDRLEILKIHLKDEDLAEDVSLADLAAKTPFYSGSDLKNLSVAAALNCVREENEQAKNQTGTDSFVYADRRTLTSAHFNRALEEISASISEDMSSLKQIKKFDEQFGDRKGKKKKSPKWGFNTASEADKALDTVKVRT